MTERSGLNTFVASASLKEQGKAAVEQSRESYEGRAEKISKGVAELALIETSHTRKIKQIVAKDLRDTYSKVGVELTEEELLNHVYLVESSLEKRSKLAEIGNYDVEAIMRCGGFNDQYGNVIVFMDEVNIEMAIRLHHELHHRLGRRMSVGLNVWLSDVAQTGHFTVGKVLRGLALEEGIVDYFSVKFVLESTAVEIRRMRNSEIWWRFLENFRKLDFEKIKLIFGKREISEAIQVLHGKRADEYEETLTIVRALLGKAERMHGTKGEERMLGLLLRTRVDPRERRRLINYVDELFGKEAGIGSSLFKTDFEEGSLRLLRARIARLMI